MILNVRNSSNLMSNVCLHCHLQRELADDCWFYSMVSEFDCTGCFFFIFGIAFVPCDIKLGKNYDTQKNCQFCTELILFYI